MIRLRSTLYRTLVIVSLMIIAAGLGWYYGVRASFPEPVEEVDSVVLMERIRNVHKLVLLEASFSEIYDYEDYWIYDVSPLRKKALVRVRANVQAGFDMEKADIELDEANRIIYIRSLPPSGILSIDHELDYYDLQEGTFNQFDETKLTDIGKNAKKFIRTQAESSGLLEEAEERKKVFIDEIARMISSYGWEVVISNDLKVESEKKASPRG